MKFATYLAQQATETLCLLLLHVRVLSIPVFLRFCLPGPRTFYRRTASHLQRHRVRLHVSELVVPGAASGDLAVDGDGLDGRRGGQALHLSYRVKAGEKSDATLSSF